MRQKLNLITLGVKDMKKSLSFYKFTLISIKFSA